MTVAVGDVFQRVPRFDDWQECKIALAFKFETVPALSVISVALEAGGTRFALTNCPNRIANESLTLANLLLVLRRGRVPLHLPLYLINAKDVLQEYVDGSCVQVVESVLFNRQNKTVTLLAAFKDTVN